MKSDSSSKDQMSDIVSEDAPLMVDEEKGSEVYARGIQHPTSSFQKRFPITLHIVLVALLALSNGAWWVKFNSRGTQESGSSCVRPQLVWCKTNERGLVEREKH